MRHNHVIGLATALALLVSSAACAQPGGGEMGSQARTTVRITVSVVPRFRLKDPLPPAGRAGTTSEGAGEVTVATNAGIRYRLVADAQSPSITRSGPPDPKAGPLRLLVVPD